ncbi:Fibronectin type III, partial [uncultured Caudovirales phage]
MARSKKGIKSSAQDNFLAPLTPTGVTATNVGTSRPYLATANTTSAVSASGTGGSVNLSWTLPAGPAATSYTITTTPSTYTVTTGTSTASYTFQGLASNTSYNFTIVATNASGSSSGATPASMPVVTTVPATPSAPTATAGVNQNSIAFSAPATGGSAITGYTVTGSDATTGSGASSPIVIADTASTSQTYTVYATNANGNSTASAASNNVTTLAPTFFSPPFFPPFFPPNFFAPPFFPPNFFAPPFFP